jgi:hypothetical protein
MKTILNTMIMIMIIASINSLIINIISENPFLHESLWSLCGWLAALFLNNKIKN